jgi:hypothetical protein
LPVGWKVPLPILIQPLCSFLSIHSASAFYLSFSVTICLIESNSGLPPPGRSFSKDDSKVYTCGPESPLRIWTSSDLGTALTVGGTATHFALMQDGDFCVAAGKEGNESTSLLWRGEGGVFT